MRPRAFSQWEGKVCQANLRVVFLFAQSYNLGVIDEEKFFRALGQRVRKLRNRRGYTQEDMIGLGFSARHWQQIEAGRPITVRTLLRICNSFHISPERLIRHLDRRG